MRCGLIPILLVAATAFAAEEQAGGDTTIAPMTPGMLLPLWPTLRASLPVGFASAQGGGVGGRDARAGVSVAAGGLSHPDPGWSWGAGAVYARTGTGGHGDLPPTIASARVVAGVWWRRSIADQLVLVAAPGVAWVEGDDGPDDRHPTGGSLPVAGLWLHQRGTTTWVLGLLAIADRDGLLPLPLIGALLAPEDWRIVLSPLLVSAERFIGADGGIGAQVGFTGASAPLEDVDGERRTLSVWDLRLGLRGRWRVDRIEFSADAGWVAVGRVAVAEGIADRDAEVHHLQPAPYAGLGVSWSW